MLNLGPSNAQFKNHCSTHPLWNRTLFCLCHDKLSLDKKVDQRWVQCSHLNDDWRGLVDVIRGFPSYIRTVGTWGQSWGDDCYIPDFGRWVYLTHTVKEVGQNLSTTLITNDPLGFSNLLMATVYGDIRWVSTECVVVSEKVVCTYFYITRDQTISWTRNRPESSKKYGWDTWPSSSDPRSTPSVPAYYVNYFGIAHRLISMRIGLWNFLSIAIIFIWVLSLIYKKRASQLQLEQSQFFSSLLINIKVEQTMVNLW